MYLEEGFDAAANVVVVVAVIIFWDILFGKHILPWAMVVWLDTRRYCWWYDLGAMHPSTPLLRKAYMDIGTSTTKTNTVSLENDVSHHIQQQHSEEVACQMEGSRHHNYTGRYSLTTDAVPQNHHDDVQGIAFLGKIQCERERGISTSFPMIELQ